MIDVLLPVLDRPGRVEPLLASLRASAAEHDLRELFIASEDDYAEIAEIERVGARRFEVPGPRAPGDYALKINVGAMLSDADWFFVGADDLHFHPGWLDACLRLHEATGALVIGTNDLGNPMVRRGLHATHSLVHRSYLEQGTIDEPGKLLHEGYDHNCVDVEFTETAIFRQKWAFAHEAVVEHLHWLWKKASSDATYTLGQSAYQADQALLRSRWPLWHHDEVTVMMRRSRRQVTGVGRREIRLR